MPHCGEDITLFCHHQRASQTMLSMIKSFLYVQATTILMLALSIVKDFLLTDTTHIPQQNHPPVTLKEAFGKEIEDALQHYEKHPHTQKELTPTLCPFDPTDPHLAANNVQPDENFKTIPVEKLTCFDKAENKPKMMSETQFAAMAMSVSALAKHDPKKYMPLVVSVIVDARRFMYDPSRINFRYGQCFSAPFAGVTPKPGDTVGDIIKGFRDSIKSQDAHSIFHDLTKFRAFYEQYPAMLRGNVSSIGPMKFKKPVLDVCLRDCVTKWSNEGDHGASSGAMYSFISYSKINENSNNLEIFSSNECSSVTMENDFVMRNSIYHFLTNIPWTTSYEDALLELENYQDKVRKQF